MTDRELLQQALDALDTYPVTERELVDALRARLAQPNDFQPDWNAMAVMVEEQRRMAKRIEGLEASRAQPEPEPFAWYSKQEDHFMLDALRKEHKRLNSYTHKVGKYDLALYTAPPQREWQGLTDEERREILAVGGEAAVLYVTEAKLRERNSG